MMSAEESFARFDGQVTTRDDLIAQIGTPPPKVVDKELEQLDELCGDFIARSTFCLVASANPSGRVDVSPKGDPAGFVKVLDPQTIAIPDRPGNRRADTFHNVVGNPNVGVLFLIPGKGETLRIRGLARIVTDRALCESMAVDGKVPKLALVVHVETAFIHCPKCVLRSQLWDPSAWSEVSDMPDMGVAMVRHTRSKLTPEEMFLEAQAEGLTAIY